jgi:hypothetical protein
MAKATTLPVLVEVRGLGTMAIQSFEERQNLLIGDG